MEFEQHPTEPNTLVIKMPKRYIAKHSDEDLRAAVLAEREACAKLCDDLAGQVGNKNFIAVDQRQFCAKQIRARSKHD